MASKNSAASRKTSCPVTRAAFEQHARPLLVRVEGMGKTTEMVATVKHFDSGSEGWYAGGRIIVMVDGTPVEAQVGLNVTLIGSKDLPQ